VDVTVAKFIASAVKLLVMVFALIAALGKFGIDVAPLIAGISVAGLGVSFALQGPLSNYASGITLIFTKPFKVGDIIEVVGVSGEVLDIKLARTDLKSLDGTMYIIPNKHIIGEIIHNCSDVKELDLNIGIGYKTDVTTAIQLMKNLIKEDKRVMREPNLGISSFGESSININARVWCKVNDYWNVMFDLNKQIFEAFKQNGIEIPYPQREIRIYKDV
jgi:small conductance mechanosensitive channel